MGMPISRLAFLTSPGLDCALSVKARQRLVILRSSALSLCPPFFSVPSVLNLSHFSVTLCLCSDPAVAFLSAPCALR
jgi:hypothetical protein